jgi:hypothetical protein
MPLADYRVLLLDADGPRWGLPVQQIEAYGVEEVAQVLDVNGDPIDEIVVYRTQISDNEGASILVPEPLPGWNAVQIHGAVPLAFSAPITVPPPE